MQRAFRLTTAKDLPAGPFTRQCDGSGALDQMRERARDLGTSVNGRFARAGSAF
jgi:hypothetical protein